MTAIESKLLEVGVLAARQTRSRSTVAGHLARLGHKYTELEQSVTAHELFMEAAAIAEGIEPDYLRPAVFAETAKGYLLGGRAHECRGASLRLLSAARNTDSVPIKALYLREAARFFYALGYQQDAAQIASEIAKYAEGQDLIPVYFCCIVQSAVAWAVQGRQENATKSIASLPDQRLQLFGLMALAQVYASIKLLSTFRKVVRQIRSAFEPNPDDLCEIACMFLDLNRPDQASTIADQAKQTMLSTGRGNKTLWVVQLARIYARLGNSEAALRLLGPAIEELRSSRGDPQADASMSTICQVYGILGAIDQSLVFGKQIAEEQARAVTWQLLAAERACARRLDQAAQVITEEASATHRAALIGVIAESFKPEDPNLDPDFIRCLQQLVQTEAPG